MKFIFARLKLFLLACMVLVLAACSPNGSGQGNDRVGNIDTSPTPVASQSVASSRTATETRSSQATVPPKPIATSVVPSPFQFGELVTPDDRSLIQIGISAASSYLTAEVGFDPSRATVYAYVDPDNAPSLDGIASAAGLSPDALQRKLGAYVGETFPSAIFLNTGAAQWQSLDAVQKMRLAAHEYFHSVQISLMGSEKARQYFGGNVEDQSAVGPVWLLEGSAEYTSWQAVQRLGLLDFGTYLATLDSLAHIDVRSLESYIGFYLGGQVSYDVSLRAVAFLVHDTGTASLLAFYDLIGGGLSWQAAFSQAFGRPIEDFYAAYKSVPSMP